MSSHAPLIEATETFVSADMSGNDGSHDMAHVRRVRDLALQLARDPTSDVASGNADAMLVVELGALLHDVKDFKYSGSRTSGPESVRAFLSTHKSDVFSEDLIDRVVHVVANVSYSKEVAIAAGAPAPELTPELAVVQDADRLDAIGAVGIARCFTFGGTRNRSLEEGLEHFDEKLLKLIGMMKTEPGREAAKKRHEYMASFVQQFQNEINNL